MAEALVEGPGASWTSPVGRCYCTTNGGSRPDLQNEFVGAVIGAMDASEDLSAQILNNPDLSQKLLDELVPIIYKGLTATA